MSRLPAVLMYHGFADRNDLDDPQRLFLGLGQFEAHVRRLRKACRPLTLDEYCETMEAGRGPARGVLVTIDDGYRSTLAAATVLARHDVPAVVFIPAGLVGGRLVHDPALPAEELLSAEELRALPSMGVDVGVHAWSHVAMAGLDGHELQRATVTARSALGDVLGRLPDAFAYPFGSVDDAAMSAVREAGYRVAFGVDAGSGRWAVARRGVARTDTPLTVAMKSSAHWTQLQRAGHGLPPVRRAAARLRVRTRA